MFIEPKIHADTRVSMLKIELLLMLSDLVSGTRMNVYEKGRNWREVLRTRKCFALLLVDMNDIMLLDVKTSFLAEHVCGKFGAI